MINRSLQNALQKVEKLIPKLEPYRQREIRELPKEIGDEIKQTEVIPAYTAGGLETVGSVLKDLYIAKTLLKDELETEATPLIPKKIETKTPVVPQPKPQNPPTTAIPAKAILSKSVILEKENNLPARTNEIITNIQVKKTSLPTASTKPTTPLPEAKKPGTIDFGHFYNKNNQPNP